MGIGIFSDWSLDELRADFKKHLETDEFKQMAKDYFNGLLQEDSDFVFQDKNGKLELVEKRKEDKKMNELRVNTVEIETAGNQLLFVDKEENNELILPFDNEAVDKLRIFINYIHTDEELLNLTDDRILKASMMFDKSRYLKVFGKPVVQQNGNTTFYPNSNKAILFELNQIAEVIDEKGLIAGDDGELTKEINIITFA